MISQSRIRGFCSRPDPTSPNLSLQVLVHLRERTRPALPDLKRTLIVDRLAAGVTGARPAFQ